MKYVWAYQEMIDVNINRFKEGARVLEDIARFVLKDHALFVKIKDLKHRVRVTHLYVPEGNDIGGADFIEKNERHTLMDIVIANGARMQEASRVLEEIEDRHFYKKIRFESYQVHAELIGKLKQYFKLDYLSGIYLLCDPEKTSIEKMAATINQSSVSICQMRMKSADKRQCLLAAKTMRARLNKQVLFIVNDHLDIAMMCADGVHLGQNDIPIEEARQCVPPDFVIGASCHSVEEAEEAIKAGASYLAVGCLYPTQTKPQAISTDLATLKQIIESSTIPVCAIGGINQNNILEIAKLKVNMIAVQTAVWQAPHPLAEIQDLQRRL